MNHDAQLDAVEAKNAQLAVLQDLGLDKYRDIAKDGQPTAEEIEAQKKWRELEETPKCTRIVLVYFGLLLECSFFVPGFVKTLTPPHPKTLVDISSLPVNGRGRMYCRHRT